MVTQRSDYKAWLRTKCTLLVRILHRTKVFDAFKCETEAKGSLSFVCHFASFYEQVSISLKGTFAFLRFSLKEKCPTITATTFFYLSHSEWSTFESKASNMKYKTTAKQKSPHFLIFRHYEIFWNRFFFTEGCSSVF